MFTILVGAGCFYFFSEKEESPLGSLLESAIKIPPHFFITNENEERIGVGMPIFSETAVLFDSFDQQVVFKKDLELSFSLRDFETKIGYTKIPYWNGNLPQWAETAPIVGNVLYWLSGSSGNTFSGKVFSVESDEQKILPVVLEGEIDLKGLGSPVFNAQGQVYGVITGADAAVGQVFMTRIDRILEYYAGGMGDN